MLTICRRRFFSWHNNKVMNHLLKFVVLGLIFIAESVMAEDTKILEQFDGTQQKLNWQAVNDGEF